MLFPHGDVRAVSEPADLVSADVPAVERAVDVAALLRLPGTLSFPWKPSLVEPVREKFPQVFVEGNDMNHLAQVSAALAGHELAVVQRAQLPAPVRDDARGESREQ